MNQYRFLNPKILSLELDELDMTDSGAGSELSFQFAYDVVNITTDVNVEVNGEQVLGLQNFAKYPFKPIFNQTPVFQPVEGDPDEDGGGFFSGVGAVVGSVTGAVAGALDFGTGLVSDAFTAASDFAGSAVDNFTAGAADSSADVRSSMTSASTDNQSSGDIGSDN